MSDELLTPPYLVAGAILVALIAYALMGGADFGGGVWDFLASGRSRDRQRALIAEAIGPIWEANHVWLILVVVILFTAFPPAFARLSTVLHIPLTIMLIGIVLRGSAFTFRSYDSRRDTVQRRWGAVFAAASVMTPVMLGVTVGTIATGRVREPEPSAGEFPSFAAIYVQPWLSPFAFAVGALTLALFAFLAAVYLTVEAPDDELREDFRRRALGAAVAVLVTAAAALALAGGDAPRIRHALTAGAFAITLHLATASAAVTALSALWRRRYRVARIAAALQVALIIAGWGFAQLPYLVPPDLTVTTAAAPAPTLRLLLIALAAGVAVLIPSLWYLFRVFKSSNGKR